MSVEKLETRFFEPENAANAQFEAVNHFENKIRREQWPDDPPKTVAETITRWQSFPSFIINRAWAVWCDEEVVAMVDGGFFDNVDHNQHVLFFSLRVAPEWRRKGIGKSLLRPIVQFARENERRLLGTQTDSTIKAGELFAEHIGAEVGLQMKINQLDLKDLDWEMMRDWQARAKERAAEYDIGLWHGPFPEAELEAIASLKETMNTAPRDELDIEDFKHTPEQIRQSEASLFKRGIERWTMYTRHRISNELAGYTEVFWDPGNPETLQQGDTAVVPAHRNCGLGRWLKAAMIEKLIAEKPQLKQVRTGNAGSNAPMLKINEEMGFYELKLEKLWQVAREKVEAYLQESG